MAAKKLTTSSLAELLKRVPLNQIKQFENFRDKTLEYHRRVHKYPEKLPRIDWEFYRNNVREDYVKMVEQFQIKYEELNHVFASRHEALDFSKYYKELDELTVQAQEDVKNYIEESNKRIQIYENEINHIKSLVPYENMTVEQFVIEREDLAKYIPGQGKPLFWPHEPTEQIPDYDKQYDIIKKKMGFKPTTKEDTMTANSSKSIAQKKVDINTAPANSVTNIEAITDTKVGEVKKDQIKDDEFKESSKVSDLCKKSLSKADSKREDSTEK